MKSPCLGCGHRSVCCHSTCKEYLEFRKVADAERKKRLKTARREDNAYNVKAPLLRYVK